MTPRILVSACLGGCNCRYDGSNCYDARIASMIQQGSAVPVCPEELGSLPTPRLPAEIVGGDGRAVLAGEARVVSREGIDVTEQFLLGARRVLEIATQSRVGLAILKSRSPSCGVGQIYDGTFSGPLKPGDGVTAAMLRSAGIQVLSSEDWSWTA